MSPRTRLVAPLAALLLALAPAPAAAQQRAPAAPVTPELLQAIPASAWAAAVLGPGAFDLQQRWLAAAPKLQQELGELLHKRVGLDLTRVEAAALYLSGPAKDPQAVVVLRLKSPGKLKGKGAGRHRGVPLVRVEGKQVVAAMLSAGLVVGSPEAVRGAIDLSKGKAPALAAGSPLGALLERSSRPGTQLAAAVHLPRLEERDLRQLVQRFELQTALFSLDSERRLELSVSGSPVRLALARTVLLQLLDRMEAKLAAEKDKAKASGGTAEALGSVVAYHQFLQLKKEATPTQQGGTLTSRYQLPDFGSTSALFAISGVLAAVAVPAFVKYLRKAKAVEATSRLYSLRTALMAQQMRAMGSGQTFRLPSSTPWTPRRSCCSGSQPRCPGGDKGFNHPSWKALDFAMDDPHRYQYRLLSKGRGPGATIELQARGDLDCDGTTSLYRFKGRLTADGELRFGAMERQRAYE